jgi:hypothetical protein
MDLNTALAVVAHYYHRTPLIPSETKLLRLAKEIVAKVAVEALVKSETDASR